jgi:hypothetical protein
MDISRLESTLSKIAELRRISPKGTTQAVSYNLLRAAGLGSKRAAQLRSASLDKIRDVVLTGQAPEIVKSKITKGAARFTPAKALYAKMGNQTQYIYKISYETIPESGKKYGTVITDRKMTYKEVKEEFINNWTEQALNGLLYTGTDENGEEVILRIKKSSIRVESAEILTPEIREKLAAKYNAK